MFNNETSYSYIIDGIYVGNIFGLHSDVINNIEQVVSLVQNPLKDHIEQKGITVYEVLFEDNANVDIVKYAEQIFHILNNGKRTFIHCSAGKSRSVSCVVYYIMKKYGNTFDCAYTFVKEKRPCSSINVGFNEQLQATNIRQTY